MASTFRFVILQAENVVVVDNTDLNVSCAELPDYIEMVVWNDGLGKIEYNDRPGVRDDFVDPSPYQLYIDRWINAAAALPSKPLLLQQAKQVKNGLLDAIYHFKRTQPASLFGYQWDCSDEGLASLHSAFELGILSGTNNALGGSSENTSGLINAINVLIDKLNVDITRVKNNWTMLIQTDLPTVLAAQNADITTLRGMISNVNSDMTRINTMKDGANTNFTVIVNAFNAMVNALNADMANVASMVGSLNADMNNINSNAALDNTNASRTSQSYAQGTGTGSGSGSGSGSGTVTGSTCNVNVNVNVSVTTTITSTIYYPSGAPSAGYVGVNGSYPSVAGGYTGMSLAALTGVLDSYSLPTGGYVLPNAPNYTYPDNNYPHIASSTGPAVQANISVLPLNGTAVVQLAIDDAANLLTNINNRRNNCAIYRTQRQNQVNALATIAQVVAFDATAGWPA